MEGTVSQYYLGALGSLLLHGVVVVLMFSNWERIDFRDSQPERNIVRATLVKLEASTPENRTQLIDLRARQEAERRAEDARQAAQQRKEEKERRQREEQVRREQLENERSEREREQELERQRLQRLEQEEQRRTDEFQRALAEETAYQTALEEQQIIDSVGSRIERLVEQNWNRPPSARRGMEVVLRVALVPTGNLASVEILVSSGDAAFDLSATQAVQRAAPFEVVRDIEPAVFESRFRTFQFRFNPEDLRL